MSTAKFQKMRLIAAKYNVDLSTLKLLKHKVESIDINELLNKIDIDTIKAKMGIDLTPIIKNSVLYLQNLDQIYDLDQKKYEEIIEIIGTSVPKFSSATTLDNAEIGTSATVDQSINDLITEYGLGSDEKESESPSEKITEASTTEEVKQVKEVKEKASDKKSVSVDEKDIKKRVESDVTTNSFCFVNEILETYDKSVHPKLIAIIKKICNDNKFTFNDEDKLVMK